LASRLWNQINQEATGMGRQQKHHIAWPKIEKLHAGPGKWLSELIFGLPAVPPPAFLLLPIQLLGSLARSRAENSFLK